ncbi:hypothetical protein [Chryseobacterium sp. W4I1]|nr:hypothetical protein [Chryseobacterium sp. W4I1]MDQ0782412.1 hypothetical protein [Chryseobacterium sp. W4I1]
MNQNDSPLLYSNTTQKIDDAFVIAQQVKAKPSFVLSLYSLLM